MKKLFLSACIALAITTVDAQTQLRGWSCAPKTLSFVGGTPALLGGNFTTIVNTSSPAQLSQAFNSMYDSEGKLLFYIANSATLYPTIYNKFNQAIGTLPAGPSNVHKEIWIIPNPLNDACTAKYYIVYGKRITTVYGDLVYRELDMNANPSPGVWGQLSSTEVTILTGATVNGGSPSYNEPSVAVSDIIGGSYHNFYVSWGTHAYYSQVTSTGISAASVIYTNAARVFDADELELSDAGNQLAWIELGTGKVNVIPVSGPTVTGTIRTFNPASTKSDINLFRGLEFDKTGNYLYFSDAYLSPTFVTISQIDVINLGTNAVSVVTGTAGYGKSMLEKSYNGNEIIMTDGVNIKGIATATQSVSAWSIAYSSFPLPNVSPLSNISYPFYGMPKQIDGRNYDNQSVIYIDFDVLNVAGTSTWSPSLNPVNQNTNYMYAFLGNSNVFNTIRIGTAIQQGSGVHLTILDLNFMFKTNAEWQVNGGANLSLYGAKLESFPCGKMWKGVNINNNNTALSNTILVTHDMSKWGEIYDALKGINTIGQNVTINIYGNNLFDKNEKHVVVNNGNGSLISIKGATFNQVTPLKDQAYGQVINSGTIKYGIYGIEVINSGSSSVPVVIGNTSSPNTFVSGQVGIHAFASNVTVLKNNFYNTDHSAIDGDANWQVGKKVEIYDSYFSNNRACVWLVFGYDGTMKRNQFLSTSEFAVRWHYNYGHILQVGDATPANGNTFNGFGWGAVVATENENLSTGISISNNTISNAPWATAVNISEGTLTAAAKTYNYYYVEKNTFTNVATAVYVSKIKGNALYGPMDDANLSSPRFDINGNTINYSTVYNAGANGITVVDCIQNRAYANSVVSDNYSNSQNIGIMFDNSPASLIKRNYVKAGQGIRLGLDMTNSNILCNTLDRCVLGINLNWCWLRAPGQIHGTPVSSGRYNTFTLCTSDMQVFYSNPTLNQWASPGTTNISYVPAASTIIASTGDLYLCGTGYDRIANPDLSNDEATSIQPELLTLIYPNPASDVVHLEIAGNNPVVEIFNSIGEKVYSVEGNGNVEVNCSGWSKGLYIVKINDGTHTENRKLIIE